MTEPDETRFLALVAALTGLVPDLLPLDAGLLASLHLGVPADSRSASKIFGIEHALILRAVAELEDRGLVAVTDRNPRTLRTGYRPTDRAHALFDRIEGDAAPQRSDTV